MKIFDLSKFKVKVKVILMYPLIFDLTLRITVIQHPHKLYITERGMKNDVHPSTLEISPAPWGGVAAA